jgi:hypothetical protein
MPDRSASFCCSGFVPALLGPQTSARLRCPPLRSPFAPSSQPPLGFLPSVPKSSLPAPTVSATRFPPPPRPPLYCSLSLRLREARHDVEPERRFSARWCPVELLFQGSKKVRAGGAAMSGGAGDGAPGPSADRRWASCILCDGCGGRIGPGARRGARRLGFLPLLRRGVVSLGHSLHAQPDVIARDDDASIGCALRMRLLAPFRSESTALEGASSGGAAP